MQLLMLAVLTRGGENYIYIFKHGKWVYESKDTSRKHSNHAHLWEFLPMTEIGHISKL
jgi:uncharacterized C2H2 Zn-finger protein